MRLSIPTILLLAAMFLLAACSSVAPSANSTEMVSGATGTIDEAMETVEKSEPVVEESHAAVEESAMESAGTAADPGAAMPETELSGSDEAMAEAGSERPEWQRLPLVDARDGTTFTIADFAGKKVFVEPMATWCTNCRRQLTNAMQARAQLGDDPVVFLGISVETNLDPAALAQYSQDFGFDWAFAVATPELLQSLVGEFGRAVINPPATPHFIIQADGTFGPLVTGIESADQLLAQLQG